METGEGRACLLLHGFTGGPFEVEPLADHLTSRGWNCRIPLLPGHGDDSLPLERVNRADWLSKAADEAEQLCRAYGEIDLVGFSMGGLISIYLANRFPVRRLVLLGVPYIYVSPGRFIREFARHTGERDWSELRTVRTTPLSATWQFTRLVHETKRELPLVQVPTFIAQGERDHVIHPASARFIVRRMVNKPELHFLPNSRHRICLESDAPHLFRLVERFFDQGVAAY